MHFRAEPILHVSGCSIFRSSKTQILLTQSSTPDSRERGIGMGDPINFTLLSENESKD